MTDTAEQAIAAADQARRLLRQSLEDAAQHMAAIEGLTDLHQRTHHQLDLVEVNRDDGTTGRILLLPERVAILALAYMHDQDALREAQAEVAGIHTILDGCSGMAPQRNADGVALNAGERLRLMLLAAEMRTAKLCRALDTLQDRLDRVIAKHGATSVV